MSKEGENKQKLDIVLLYVEDKKNNKVKDIEIAVGIDEDAKTKAYLKLTESNTNITSDDVINKIELCNIQAALPTNINHKLKL